MPSVIDGTDNFETTVYESGEQAIASGGVVNLTHGLAGKPLDIQYYLVCKVADAGYSIGDELLITPNVTEGSSGANKGIASWFDAVNINVRYGSDASVFNSLNKSSGVASSLTNTRWRLVVRARP